MTQRYEVPGSFPEPSSDESTAFIRAQPGAIETSPPPLRQTSPPPLRQAANAAADKLVQKPHAPPVTPVKPPGEPARLSDFSQHENRRSTLMLPESRGASKSTDAAKFESGTSEVYRGASTRGNLDHAEDMKERVRQALVRPQYDVKAFYYDTGWCQELARNPYFEHVTLAVITVNAVWIAVDTDHNDEAFLLDAHWVFQVAEHAFCAFFLFEWLVRFCSFRRKFDGFKDYWFAFDTVLVGMMVSETWIMTIVIVATGGAGGGPLGSTGVLRLFRLLRLSRMARMLRRCPELMILIKGMVAACRSVFFTLLLLLIVMYMFAIALTQLTDGTVMGDDHFDTIPDSMFTLLVVGTFQDNIMTVMTQVGSESYVVAGVFLLFVVIGALMIMNMLIGVLCEVVSEVAEHEREEMNVSYVRGKMLDVVMKIDDDENMEISKEEFATIMTDRDAVRALEEVGVDAFALIEMTDFIFEDEETHEDKSLSFCEFMDTILEFRGSNKATVKDFVDLRKFIKTSLDRLLRNFARDTTAELGKVSTGETPTANSHNVSVAAKSQIDPATNVIDLPSHIGKLEAFLTAGLFELQRSGSSGSNASPPRGRKIILPPVLSSPQMGGQLAASELDQSGLLKRMNKFVAFAIDEIQNVRSALPLPGAGQLQRNPQMQDLRVALAQLEEQLLTFGPDGTFGKQVPLANDTFEWRSWVEQKVAQFTSALSVLQLAQERLASNGSASSHDTFRNSDTVSANGVGETLT